MRILQIFAAVMVAVLIAQPTYAQQNAEIQMLPPSGCGTVGSTPTSPFLSFNWSALGGSAINCNQNFYIDGSGNINQTAGSLYVGVSGGSVGISIDGSSLLTGTSATTILNLQTQSCGANQALTEVTPTNFQCVDIVQLAEFTGPVLVPTCMAVGQSLTWTGAQFVCANNNVANCPSGQVLTGVANGQPQCTPMTFQCPTGQVLQSVNGGTPTCTTASVGYPTCGIPSTISIEEVDGQTPAYQCNPICPSFTYFQDASGPSNFNFPAATAIGQIDQGPPAPYNGGYYDATAPYFTEGSCPDDGAYRLCTSTGWTWVYPNAPGGVDDESCIGQGTGVNGSDDGNGAATGD